MRLISKIKNLMLFRQIQRIFSSFPRKYISKKGRSFTMKNILTVCTILVASFIFVSTSNAGHVDFYLGGGGGLGLGYHGSHSYFHVGTPYVYSYPRTYYAPEPYYYGSPWVFGGGWYGRGHGHHHGHWGGHHNRHHGGHGHHGGGHGHHD